MHDPLTIPVPLSIHGTLAPNSLGVKPVVVYIYCVYVHCAKNLNMALLIYHMKNLGISELILSKENVRFPSLVSLKNEYM